jgi:hypothetical protein
MQNVFRSSADRDIPGRCGRKDSVLLESLLLSLIRQGFEPWREFGFKLYLWRFTFLNYTKLTKYEALEKNAVSRHQIA